MKRVRIELTDVADLKNLIWAAWRASRGKRQTSDVRVFFADLLGSLQRLRQDILSETYIPARCRVFHIRDPKPRVIHAPAFRDRVLQHALVRYVEPVLNNVLVDDSFACRVGKGTTAAVRRAQQHSQRFSWYVKMDVRKYFATISHRVLKDMLRRRFKGPATLRLMDTIIGSHSDAAVCGLPIGALTSQALANFYLSGLDRMLLNHTSSQGYVRYMDDFVVWCDGNHDARLLHGMARDFLEHEVRLELKQPIQINRSREGLTLCGFRIFPGTVLLAPGRRRRFLSKLKRRQGECASGIISEQELQAGFDALFGVSKTAQIRNWLATCLRRNSGCLEDEQRVR